VLAERPRTHTVKRKHSGDIRRERFEGQWHHIRPDQSGEDSRDNLHELITTRKGARAQKIKGVTRKKYTVPALHNILAAKDRQAASAAVA